MPWPDIFFKARKPPAKSEASPAKPLVEKPKLPGVDSATPEIKPVAIAKETPSAPVPVPPPPFPATQQGEPAPDGPGTIPIPVTHGVILRPPGRVVIGPSPGTEPIKNVEQLMAEADPVRTLSQTGSVRLLKRLAPDPHAAKPAPPKPPPAGLSKSILLPPATSSPWPQFAPKTPAAVMPIEVKKDEPVLASTPAPEPVLTEVNPAQEDETPFILKSAAETETAPTVSPEPTESPNSPLGSIFRRKAKMADVARIVLPPKRDESTRLPFPPLNDPSPTVVPPAFPVAAMTQRPSKPISESPETGKETSDLVESPFLERSAGEPRTIAAPSNETSRVEETPKPAEPATPAPVPVREEKSPEPMSLFPDPPKVDPQAHKPEPAELSTPKVDPEAHRPPPQAAPPVTSTAVSVAPETAPREKREFHLTNGEHVAGVVLSETPEAIYVEHATLGVITVPRNEIAKRLVEIILINGDRIVGDIMAETADMLYVRHSSLGMLSVPRTQRSTRVVEAILKDGDRILGEVLTETDAFTVIRSATLGTITVPHSKMAMLNRKIEQIDMKALPPPAPELKDKSSS